MNPMKRLMEAWTSTDLPLGRFLDNTRQLAGVGLRFMSDEDLADAAEKYAVWRKEYQRAARIGMSGGLSKERIMEYAKQVAT